MTNHDISPTPSRQQNAGCRCAPAHHESGEISHLLIFKDINARVNDESNEREREAYQIDISITYSFTKEILYEPKAMNGNLSLK